MKCTDKEPFTITEDYDSISEKDTFQKLLTVLMAYAHSLIGNSSLRLEKNRGELAYDFAMETIKRHISNPLKFDPKRNKDLVKYLKFNILRQLISNFKELSGQKNEKLFEIEDSTGIKVANTIIEECDIYTKIDLKTILDNIQLELLKEPILRQIFRLRYYEEYKRVEICEELNISNGELNNCIRRLDTILKKVLINQQVEI